MGGGGLVGEGGLSSESACYSHYSKFHDDSTVSMLLFEEVDHSMLISLVLEEPYL